MTTWRVVVEGPDGQTDAAEVTLPGEENALIIAGQVAGLTWRLVVDLMQQAERETSDAEPQQLG